MRCHPPEWLKLKWSTAASIGEEVEQTETHLRCWMGYKIVQLLCQAGWWFLITLRVHLPHDPVIPFSLITELQIIGGKSFAFSDCLTIPKNTPVDARSLTCVC